MPLLLKSGELVTMVIPVLVDSQIYCTMIKPLSLVERQAIESALILCEGNKKKAARLLGISYVKLLRRIHSYCEEDN